MAKPNYDFAKRQRELAKKAKKEEKLRKKTAGEPDGEATDDNAENTADESTVADSGDAATKTPTAP